MLTRSQLFLDGISLGTLDGDELDVGNALENLRVLLKRKRQLYKQRLFHGPLSDEVTLEVDRNLPFEWVKQVSGACARAGYPRIGFLGIRRQAWSR